MTWRFNATVPVTSPAEGWCFVNKKYNLTGKVFEGMYVDSYAGKGRHGQYMWNVVVVCHVYAPAVPYGTWMTVPGADLKSGRQGAWLSELNRDGRSEEYIRNLGW